MSEVETTRPRDRYDQEVERLTAHPDDIEESWSFAKPLFSFCSRRRNTISDDGETIGCLVMIRSNPDRFAETDELTAMIRADDRIPQWSMEIAPEHLPVFAEWQRKIDLALGRTPPHMLPDPDEAAYLHSISAAAPDVSFPGGRDGE